MVRCGLTVIWPDVQTQLCLLIGVGFASLREALFMRMIRSSLQKFALPFCAGRTPGSMVSPELLWIEAILSLRFCSCQDASINEARGISTPNDLDLGLT